MMKRLIFISIQYTGRRTNQPVHGHANISTSNRNSADVTPDSKTLIDSTYMTLVYMFMLLFLGF